MLTLEPVPVELFLEFRFPHSWGFSLSEQWFEPGSSCCDDLLPFLISGAQVHRSRSYDICNSIPPFFVVFGVPQGRPGVPGKKKKERLSWESVRLTLSIGRCSVITQPTPQVQRKPRGITAQHHPYTLHNGAPEQLVSRSMI